MRGNFVVQRLENRFSMMAKDQSHEHSNDFIKGDGGASGLYDEPISLLTWIIASPQRAKIITNYDELISQNPKPNTSSP